MGIRQLQRSPIAIDYPTRDNALVFSQLRRAVRTSNGGALPGNEGAKVGANKGQTRGKQGGKVGAKMGAKMGAKVGPRWGGELVANRTPNEGPNKGANEGPNLAKVGGQMRRGFGIASIQ